jgi:S-adenosyl methyltransferase
VHFLLDDDQAHAILTRLIDALPAGSYLLLSHYTAQVHREAMLEYQRLWNENATPPITTRSSGQISRFFDRLELLEPGVISCPLWRPAPRHIGTPVEVDMFCGVGRKPMSRWSSCSPVEALPSWQLPAARPFPDSGNITTVWCVTLKVDVRRGTVIDDDHARGLVAVHAFLPLDEIKIIKVEEW